MTANFKDALFDFISLFRVLTPKKQVAQNGCIGNTLNLSRELRVWRRFVTPAERTLFPSLLCPSRDHYLAPIGETYSRISRSPGFYRFRRNWQHSRCVLGGASNFHLYACRRNLLALVQCHRIATYYFYKMARFRIHWPRSFRKIVGCLQNMGSASSLRLVHPTNGVDSCRCLYWVQETANRTPSAGEEGALDRENGLLF